MDQKIQTKKRKAVEQIWGKYVIDKEEGWLRFMRDELKYDPKTSAEKFIGGVVAASRRSPLAIRSCHGTGKTAFGSVILITSITLIPDLVLVQISPTWRQVTKIFWNEVRKWWGNSNLVQTMFDIQDKAPEVRSKLRPNTWFAIGMAAKRQGLAEGYHNAKYIMRLTDETKAIDDEIIEGTDGMLSVGHAWTVDLSTPTSPQDGFRYFYDCFGRIKKGRTTIHIEAKDSKLVTQEWVNMMAAKYGIDSPIYQARVLGNFPESGDDILIPLKVVERFMEQQEDFEPAGGHCSVGVDVARYGQDESVISVWQGKTLIYMEPASGKATTQLSEIAWRIATQYKARAICVDDIGVGGGVTDQLAAKADSFKQFGIQVIPFIASQSATEEDKFEKFGDEIWWYFAEDMKTGQLHSLIEDDDLLHQLTSYKKIFTPREKIKVEWPKRKERQSESHSPDRGDAVVLGWYAQRVMVGARQSFEEAQEEYGGGGGEFTGIDRREF